MLKKITRLLRGHTHAITIGMPELHPMPEDRPLTNEEVQVLDDDGQWFALRVRHALNKLGCSPGVVTTSVHRGVITASAEVRIHDNEIDDIVDTLALMLFQRDLHVRVDTL